MTAQFDFKKEWEKTKNQLLEFSKEAAKVAKKGEDELVKFSQKSMVHIDATAVNLKKEKLYYQIGKEYIVSLNAKGESELLKKLIDEYNETVKEEKALQSKIKSSAPAAKKKNTARKSSVKKKKAEKKESPDK